MFALLLCIASGISPIITSSSDTKLENIKKLSPLIKGYNYKTTPSQTEEVKRLTNNKGVDIVINTTGPASLIADIESLRGSNGSISLVGFLDHKPADWDPNAIMGLMAKTAKIQ